MVWLVILIVVLVLLALLAFLAWPGQADKAVLAPFYGLNHAHRGLHDAGGTRPENSLAAFEAACAAGYGIELDVQFSKDRQVVVFHDDDLARVCGMEKRVDELTFEELGALRLEGSEERIPLFSEMLRLVAGRAPLIVELKTGPHNAELSAATLALLRNYDGPYCIESFDPRIVHWFHKNAPDVLRGQLAAPPRVLEQGAAGLLIGWGLCHFLGRPQFIAYQAVRRPPIVWLAQRRAMPVTWTLTPQLDTAAFEAKNDATIFEGYAPPAHYKTLP